MGCGSSAPVELTGSETHDELRELVRRGSVDAAVVCVSNEECDLRGDLKDFTLGVKGANTLGEAIGRPTCKAKKLVLRGTKLGGGAQGPPAGMGLKKFAAGLAANTSIEVLDLSGNEIGDYEAEKLAAALETNRTLKTLILFQNRIGKEGGGSGAKAIGKALRSGGNDALRELRLNMNCIDSDGTTKLAEALATNSSLKVLRYETFDMFDPIDPTRGLGKMSGWGDATSGLMTGGPQSSYLGAEALRTLSKARPDLDITFTSKAAQHKLSGTPDGGMQHLHYAGGKLVRTVDLSGDSGPPVVTAS
jgi:hypothetical protein